VKLVLFTAVGLHPYTNAIDHRGPYTDNGEPRTCLSTKAVILLSGDTRMKKMNLLVLQLFRSGSEAVLNVRTLQGFIRTA
jgi:hypothetical protein